MERCVTLIRVTTEGRKRHQGSGDHSNRIAEVVESFGGRIEGIWELGGRPCRFVSVATYPDRASALQARTHIEAIGMTTVEGYPVVEMPECLQAMAA